MSNAINPLFYLFDTMESTAIPFTSPLVRGTSRIDYISLDSRTDTSGTHGVLGSHLYVSSVSYWVPSYQCGSRRLTESLDNLVKPANFQNSMNIYTSDVIETHNSTSGEFLGNDRGPRFDND
ncbi:2215_t:CDS:2 [Acaulospora colombiana]|uniref:2215_t:CDS:1 n=1 Tax=Acaulospora colombiana TaxID=27376 RepID=A0ACA9NV89_9GLOM|nr:2215_t:CDS:2 [Acaulospora colombiana]